MSRQSYHTIIIGGGIIGLSIAYELGKRGIQALVLEKGKIGAEASSAAAGMLAAQAEADQAGPLFDLCRMSRDLYGVLAKELRSLTGKDIRYNHQGLIKTAYSDEGLKHLKQIYQFQIDRGEQVEWLDKQDITALEPSVSGTAVEAGLLFKKDAQVDAPITTLALAAAAIEKGAELREHAEVETLRINDGKVTAVYAQGAWISCENVVLAAGAWSESLWPTSDLPLPMIPVKGVCVSVKMRESVIKHTLFNENCYIVPKFGNRLLIGATSEPKRTDKIVTTHAMMTLLERASGYIPSLTDAEFERAWAGIRPQTSDGMPVLGPHPCLQNYFSATGHYRNGILLAPLTGVMLADWVTGGQPPVSKEILDAVSPKRFRKLAVKD